MTMATFGWSDDNDSETEIVHDQSLTPQTKCDSEVGAETPNHVFQGKLRSIGSPPETFNFAASN